MKIRILAVGTKMPAWVETGVADYHKRLAHQLNLSWHELPLGTRSKKEGQQAIAQEGNAMLAAIKPDDRVVALDVAGKTLSTHDLAQQLTQWRLDARNISLLIGGPDGLDERCLSIAEQRISLSRLTLPHPLVRIILAEQLYRAWSLTQNHPYHK